MNSIPNSDSRLDPPSKFARVGTCPGYSGDEFLTLMYREDVIFDIRKETK